MLAAAISTEELRILTWRSKKSSEQQSKLGKLAQKSTNQNSMQRTSGLKQITDGIAPSERLLLVLAVPLYQSCRERLPCVWWHGAGSALISLHIWKCSARPRCALDSFFWVAIRLVLNRIWPWRGKIIGERNRVVYKNLYVSLRDST